MKKKEPKQLKSGKQFHAEVQSDWEKTADGTILPETVINLLPASFRSRKLIKGRIDILVEDIDDENGRMVAIVEIKSTDWDRIKSKNIIKNLGSHRRQIWKYIDKYYEGEGCTVCPGLIYPDPPTTEGLRERIVTYLNDYGIQVVWYREK